MEILYLLVPIALVFVFIAVKVLFWAIKNGQYDDLNTEANRILFDDQPRIKRKAIDPSKDDQKASQEKPE